MKIILSCGGTGGHIYPALAIADEIRAHHPEAQILFIGTHRALENEVIPAHGYDIMNISASGFHRREIWKNVKTLKDTLEGASQAKKIIREFQPDLVIGTGGYVCGPVVRAAHKMGIPTAIHEQNAFPGMTNKMLSKYVDKIFISFDEAKKYFQREEGVFLVGNPLRKGFVVNEKAQMREKLGLDPSRLTVLCFGGSLGAMKINELMVHLIGTLNGAEDVSVLFVTGKRFYGEVLEKLRERTEEMKDNIRVFEYLDNMPEYMAASDVIISRAGALTLAEITACGKAAILIPSPYVTGNHQYHNARVLSDMGAAELIEEKDLTDEAVLSILGRLRKDPQLLAEMEEKSRSLARTDAAEQIYGELKEYLVPGQ